MTLPLEVFLERWSALHGDHVPRGLTRSWLAVVRQAARPLAAARVPPWTVTLLALATAALAVPVARLPLLAAALVLVSGLLDGLDGAVAVLRDRASRMGFVLDSTADRLADGLLMVALWRLGAAAGWCVGAGAAAWLGEYVRARAGNAGLREIGVVTVGERPTRLLVTAAAFAAAPLLGHGRAATAGAMALLVLALVALGQLGVVVRRVLR